jgi:tetratricopeptide (TPR) repeat protein
LAAPEKTVAQVFQEGIIACREERWREGYGMLNRVAQAVDEGQKLPSVFYSYLGLCMALCDGRKDEGLKLCRYAVRQEPRQPENQLNLAVAYRILLRRRECLKALQRGLRLSPNHPRLRALEAELGIRRKPVLPFFKRTNLLNKYLGILRARYQERRSQRRQSRLEEEALAMLDKTTWKP